MTRLEGTVDAPQVDKCDVQHSLRCERKSRLQEKERRTWSRAVEASGVEEHYMHERHGTEVYQAWKYVRGFLC